MKHKAAGRGAESPPPNDAGPAGLNVGFGTAPPGISFRFGATAAGRIGRVWRSALNWPIAEDRGAMHQAGLR